MTKTQIKTRIINANFGTTAGISGVSTGSSIVNLVTFTITGLSMGVTVVMGRYLGEKKPERVGQVVGGAIWLFFVLACIIAYNVISSISRGIGDSNMPLVFVGIAQTFIVRLPMSYIMSIQPDASLTMIGLAAPCATIFGIVINLLYFMKMSREMKYSRKN